MIMLSISEFFRNGKRNAFLVLLLTVMGAVLAVVTSLILYEYQLYAPFIPLQGQEGFYYSRAGSNNNSYEDTEGIAEIYQTFSSDLKVTGQESYITCYSIPQWIWGKWSARMEEGSWFEDLQFVREQYPDAVPVLVGGMAALQRYHIGDVLTYESGNKIVQLVVQGILVANTEINGVSTSYSSSTVDYQMFYGTPYKEEYFLAQTEIAQEQGMRMASMYHNVIVYRPDIDPAVRAELEARIQNDTSGASLSLQKFNENNRLLFGENIITYVPIVGIGILLVLICTYAAAYINMERNLYHYSIFYLLGSSWWQRFAICMGNAGGVTFFSVLLLICTYFGVQALGFGTKILLLIDWHTYLLLGIYYLVFLIFMTLLSYFTLRGVSPKQALTRRAR